MTLITYPFADLGSVARASVKQVQDAAGAWVEIAPNTMPRSGTRGAWVEGAGANAVRNALGIGGVVGAPGTPPTHWIFNNPASGLSREILSPVLLGNVLCQRIRYSGTASSGLLLGQYEGNNIIAATTGEAWTQSVFLGLQINSGATPDVRLSNRETAADGTTPINADTIGVNISASLTTQAARFTRTTTLSGAGTAFVAPAIRLGLVTSTVYDFTLIIGWPQMQRAAFASSPVLPAPGVIAASSRAEDNITIPLSSSRWTFSPAAGTIVAEFDIPQSAPVGANQTVLALNDGTDANRLVIRNAAGGAAMQVVSIVGGVEVATLALGNMTPNQPGRIVLVYSSAGLVASLNGGAAQTATTAHPAALLTGAMLIGRGMLASTYLNGYIRDVLYLPRGLANADAVTLANPAVDARAMLAAIGA